MSTTPSTALCPSCNDVIREPTRLFTRIWTDTNGLFTYTDMCLACAAKITGRSPDTMLLSTDADVTKILKSPDLVPGTICYQLLRNPRR